MHASRLDQNVDEMTSGSLSAANVDGGNMYAPYVEEDISGSKEVVNGEMSGSSKTKYGGVENGVRASSRPQQVA